MNLRRRDALGLGAAMLGTAALAAWARPRAADPAGVRLADVFPTSFGPWRLDPAMALFVRTNDRNGKPYAFYDQVLERTYVDDRGARIMLSAAFGNEQSTALQLHRPEVCYRASGYRVADVHAATLALPGVALPVTRLHASRPGRSEPITYWTIVGGEPVADRAGAVERRIRFALQRRLPDGLLVRVSSIDDRSDRAWALHASFAAALADGVAPAQRQRLLGDAAHA